MKKIIFAIFAAAFLFNGAGLVFAQDIEVDFFYSPTCPHCAKEKTFLRGLKERYPDLKINQYDVINNRDNQIILGDFYEKYDVPESLRGLVPATFTPTKYFIGFDDKISEELESCLKECFYRDNKELALKSTSIIDKTFKIPLLGEINLSRLSFPVMAVVLGSLDGFNVCSLGALILILTLVLAFNSRKKILIFGLVFILTTAAVYGSLIFFWYKLFEAIAPYLRIMNLLIGIFGIAGGIYFFKQFWRSKNSNPTCDSESGSKISSRFLPKLQKMVSGNSSILLALGAVFAFAFVLTVVEFPCSAVVPVAFAAALAQAGLPPALYVFYISLFVLFYLLDEIIVFLFACFTSKIWLSSPKFLKWIILLEAIILLSFGFYYLSSSL